MISIAKQANDKNAFRRSFTYFDDARSAWSWIINFYLKDNPDLTLLLPSYIGFSVNEGSGIFDPVRELDVNFEFYALNKNLEIDVKDLKQKSFENKNNVLVLLVHYFGFPDKNYEDLCNWLDGEGIEYSEDCAHAMLTDLIGGICGRRGRFTFYSIHKLLPYNYGGVLVSNHNMAVKIENKPSTEPVEIFDFDLKSIFNKRRENYKYLADVLRDFVDIELLYPNLSENIAPQSLPVFIKSKNRDEIYFKMNELGFGLVSLYHTMIDQLKNTEYASANYTSKNITNLPVHQDCTKDDLMALSENFKKVLALN